MLFHQFTVPGLAHHSYAVGCLRQGVVAIVDPEREVDAYLAFARAHHVRITLVLETHIHADYASGALELAERTGAELGISAYDQGETFRVEAPHRRLFEDEELEVGNVVLRVIHTPGHTPEHVSYLVFDRGRSADVPVLLLTGDFLFAGSLGRPDLLGEDVQRELAGQLFRSAHRKLAELPDGLEVYPAHGSGSMCGAGLIGRSVTTLGYERATNPLLDEGLTEEEFVARVLAELPPIPDYFRRMKRLNSEGPVPTSEAPGGEGLDATAFRRLLDGGAVVLDVRDQAAFGAGHVPGAYALGAGPLLSTWAGWILPPEVPLLLVASTREETEAAVRGLRRVGLDDVRGYLAGGLEAWCGAGGAVARVEQLTLDEARELHAAGRRRLVDVRSAEDRESAPIDGAPHVPGWEIDALREAIGDPTEPLALVCNTGYVSTLVASLLRRAGHEDVANVAGGIEAA